MRSKPLCLLAGLALVPLAGQAASPIETELDLETVLVLTPLAENDGTQDTEPLLGEMSLTAQSQAILDNGVRVRARGAFRLQADHPERPGGTGGFGQTVGAPVGAFSGLSDGPNAAQPGFRGRLETAYLQIDGGYGEVRMGKDLGVAARFHEGVPGGLSHARLDSSLLDPAGLSSVQTRHDLTGPSAKLSYASPRLLGVRAGLSFTPEADADGLDRRASAGLGGIGPDISNALELALNASRKLPQSGVRIDLAAAWSRADVAARPSMAAAPYRDVETWSAGSQIEAGDWQFGGAWLSSDNGLADGDYRAWSAGALRALGPYELSVNYGEATDEGAELDGTSLRLAGARRFSDDTRLALAYFQDDLTGTSFRQQSQGIVVEITLSEKILQITGN